VVVKRRDGPFEISGWVEVTVRKQKGKERQEGVAGLSARPPFLPPNRAVCLFGFNPCIKWTGITVCAISLISAHRLSNDTTRVGGSAQGRDIEREGDALVVPSEGSS